MPVKESDIAKDFITYFSEMCYDVFPEVHVCGGIVDFYAYLYPTAIAVEVKTEFNFKVLEQAINNKKHSHYSYIATPFSNSNLNAKMTFCEDYGVGWLALRNKQIRPTQTHASDYIDEIIKPKLNRTIAKPKLEDWMKQSVAGSQNDRVTPFQNMVASIVKEINEPRWIMRDKGRKAGDPITIDYAFEHCMNKYYGSLTAAKRNIYQWCRTGVIKEFRLEKGMIILGSWDSVHYSKEELEIINKQSYGKEI